MTAGKASRAWLPALVGGCVLLQSLSFLSVKFSTLQAGWASLTLLGLAFCLMGARARFWQAALQRADLSAIYPFMALAQVLIFLYAIFLFGESARSHHLVGLLVMVTGVALLNSEPGG